MTRRSKTKVVITHSFELDLERIAAFLTRVGAAHRIDELANDVIEGVIPMLERVPRVGQLFHDQILDEEGRLLFERIMRRLAAREARTLVRGDFVVLFLLGDVTVHLVGARHHREAGFRLGQHPP